MTTSTSELDFRGTLCSVSSFLSIFLNVVRQGFTKSYEFLCNFLLFVTFLKKNNMARELMNLVGGFGGEGEGEECDKGTVDNVLSVSECRKRERDDITKYPKFYLEEVREKKSHDKAISQPEEGEASVDYENLKSNFIFEKTPMGNVIMYYNKDRNSFEYYTDNIIPYRILDTVARKYVLTYDCCELYIDMEKEIKEYVLNGVPSKKEEKKGAGATVQVDKDMVDDPVKSKPNVFAKFKSYNKDSSKISDVVGAKDKATSSSNSDKKVNGGGGSSVVNTSKVSVEENSKILLKEKANVYTCLGKFSNFSMLKKVDRAVVDKNYTMSFSEYKKMLRSGKNYGV
jgi:hypothetical protein